MRWLLVSLSAVLATVGTIWVLQGVGLLPGSFMTGQAFWAAVGALCLASAAAALWIAWRISR